MIRQCCQCKRVWKEGRWTFARLSQLDLAEVSHGYCEDCFDKQMNKTVMKRKQFTRPWRRLWLRLHT
jgi:hypothetical protein